MKGWLYEPLKFLVCTSFFVGFWLAAWRQLQAKCLRCLDPGTSPHFNAATTITHNALGVPVSVRNPVNVATEFECDTLGNLTAIVANVANLRQRSALAYDSVGNAISMTNPRGGATTNS